MEIDDKQELVSNSDHNWILCDIAIAPMTSEATQPRQVWNLRRDTDWAKFRTLVEEKGQAWLNREWGEDSTEPKGERMTSEFNQILIECGQEAVGLKWVGGSGGGGRDPVDQDLEDKVKTRKQACKAFNRAKRLREARKVSQESVDKKKGILDKTKEDIRRYYLNKWRTEVHGQLEHFKEDPTGKAFWTWAKKKIRRGDPNHGIRTRNGTRVFTAAEIRRELFEYYSDLVAGRQGPLSEGGGYSLPKGQSEERDQRDQMLFEEVRLRDIEEEVSKFKNGKAVALDRIPNEFLKYGGAPVWRMMRKIFNTVLQEGKYPPTWKKGWTSFIPKPSSDGSLDNMRGLTINSSVGKVLLKIIQARLTLDAEDRGVLGEMQHGFRQGFQTLDALYVLTETVARRKLRGQKTAAAFIDIKKAYDWVDRDVLWGKLEGLGFGTRLISFLRDMYDDTTTRVRYRGIETDEIPVQVGLKQGCCLSPILFAMYIQEISEDLARSGEGVLIGPEGKQVRVPALLFADDLVLIAESEKSLQRLLDIVGHGARKLNMTLSPEKSKILLSWRGPDKNRKWNCGYLKIAEGRRVRVKVEIEEEGEYKYLGVFVRFYERMFEKQADSILVKARRHRGMNSLIWLRSYKSVWVATKLWVHAALPAILYGSEIMVLDAQDILKVDRMISFLPDFRKTTLVNRSYVLRSRLS